MNIISFSWLYNEFTLACACLPLVDILHHSSDAHSVIARIRFNGKRSSALDSLIRSGPHANPQVHSDLKAMG